MNKTVKIGPFSGINNVQSSSASAFQVSEGKSIAVVAANDVDLNDDGWPTNRLPIAIDTTIITPLGGWDIAGRMFYQAADRLYERTTTDIVLISGLVSRVSICEHWGLIFVTDGTNHWEIDGTTVRVWGLPIPEIVLSPATGNLVAGQYLVQCAFIDARGNEGGTSDTELVTLTSATGILVSISNQSPEVVGVNIYVSRRDQKQTSYLTTVALGNLPYTIINVDTTIADPPKTLQMTGPITSAAGIFSFRAFILMWRDGVVFRSESAEPHLFHGDNFMQFGSDVRACEGVTGKNITGGMWIGTDNGLWWIQGEDPSSWLPIRKTFSSVLRGSIRIQGNKIKNLETDDLVALFATKSGLVAGMPDGTALHLTDGIYTFPSHARASFAYVEKADPLHTTNDLRQILIGLVED